VSILVAVQQEPQQIITTSHTSFNHLSQPHIISCIMAFLRKIVRAVTLWSNADLRRAEVLSETIFYGIGMAMIGTRYRLIIPSVPTPVFWKVYSLLFVASA